MSNLFCTLVAMCQILFLAGTPATNVPLKVDSKMIETVGYTSYSAVYILDTPSIKDEVYIPVRKLDIRAKRLEANKLRLSDDDVELIAKVTWLESGGECEKTQRLVIDSILNRYDSKYFPDTIRKVVYQKNQYSVVSYSKFNSVTPRERIYELIEEELRNRTNDEVLYFRTNHYHRFGTPLFSIDNVYFSTR